MDTELVGYRRLDFYRGLRIVCEDGDWRAEIEINGAGWFRYARPPCGWWEWLQVWVYLVGHPEVTERILERFDG